MTYIAGLIMIFAVGYWAELLRRGRVLRSYPAGIAAVVAGYGVPRGHWARSALLSMIACALLLLTFWLGRRRRANGRLQEEAL